MLINKTLLLNSVDKLNKDNPPVITEIFFKENILSVKCFFKKPLKNAFLSILVFDKAYIFSLNDSVCFSEKIVTKNSANTADELILIMVFTAEKNGEEITPLYLLENNKNYNENFYKKVREEFEKINSEIIYDDYKIAEENYYLLEEEKIKNDGESFCNENACVKEQIEEEKKKEYNDEETKNYDYETTSEYEENDLIKRLKKLKDGAFSHTRLVEKPTKLIKNAVFYTAFDENLGEFFIGEKIDAVGNKYIVYLFKSALVKSKENLEKIACFYPITYFNDENGFYAIFQDEKSGKVIEF